tara:strand:+ start:460 stop:651 length:192 start_codon:yes stop_codon:yes gene_type:complete
MKMKLAKKIPCEVEVFNGGKLIDKYIAIAIEQANEQGEIFVDKYLHPQCEYIRNIKKDGTSTN